MKNPYGFNLDYTYTSLPNVFFSPSKPDIHKSLSLIYFNDGLAKDLSLNVSRLNTPEGIRFLAGQTIESSMHPYAMAYAGHQYGQFTNLGDGRAIMLGEHKTDNQRIDCHLKGAGATPYARGFDGKATLRSMLLEYVYSEALHALNIPTSRSLAVIKSDETIMRIGKQSRGLLLRTMQSHLRVGTIEYARRFEDLTHGKKLIDYAIERLDSDLVNEPNKIINFYANIIKRQAKLVASWQSVGFVHGVLNTDNTTLSGETIDFGPCAFLDDYDLNAVFSSIDYYGRYAFGRQPTMVSWNLAKLGEALLPFIDTNQTRALKRVQALLDTFKEHFASHFYTLMTQKIGLQSVDDNSIALVDEFLTIMQKNQMDYTYTFYRLTYDVETLIQENLSLKDWVHKWRKHTIKTSLMQSVNPLAIPRNHRIKDALDRAVNTNDYTLLNEILIASQNPFTPNKVPNHLILPPKEKKPFVTYCGT